MRVRDNAVTMWDENPTIGSVGEDWPSYLVDSARECDLIRPGA